MKRDYIVNIIFLILGAVIGLTSSRLSHHWDLQEQESIVANQIKGSVIYEIDSNTKLLKLLENILSEKKNKKLNPTSFKWIHRDDVVIMVGSNFGYMNSEILRNLNSYLSVLYQCQAFRDTFVNNLESKNWVIGESKKELESYIRVLKHVVDNGDKLLLVIEKYYPSK